MSFILFLGLMLVGSITALLGSIINVAQAFNESILWGLFCLFVPLLASPIFVHKFWKEREWVRISSFLVSGGGALMFLGTLFDPHRSKEYAATDANFANPKQELYTDTQAASTITYSASAAANNPFQDAINIATQASSKTQTAKTKDEWRTVAATWQDSIALLNTVPQSDANYAIAQTKVVEYSNNLTYAQQNAQ